MDKLSDSDLANVLRLIDKGGLALTFKFYGVEDLVNELYAKLKQEQQRRQKGKENGC